MSGAVSVGVAVVAIAAAVETSFATFAVIAAVGATVGAIGAVTKVKELQYIGMAIGAVGAVGGLASAAGMFGAAADLVGGAGSFGAAGVGELGLANAGTSAMAGVDNLAGLGASASQADAAWAASQIGNAATDAGHWGQIADAINSVETATGGPVVNAASSPTISTAFDGADDVLGGFSDGEAVGTDIVNDPLVKGTEAVQGTTATTTPGTPAAPSVPGTPTSGVPASAGAQPTALETLMGSNVGASPGVDSSWKDIWDFVKNNKSLIGGAVQGGFSFLSGALNPLTDSQQKALDAQAKANQAAANKYNAETGILQMQRDNMGQPIPRATRVTGVPSPVGLVNQASPVTGVPA